MKVWVSGSYGSYRISVPIYDHTVDVIIGHDNVPDDYVDLFEGYDDCEGACEHNSGCHVILLFNDLTANTIAHECVHASMHLLNDSLVSTTVKEQEPLAYLVGYLVEQIESIIKHHKRVKKS